VGGNTDSGPSFKSVVGEILGGKGGLRVVRNADLGGVSGVRGKFDFRLSAAGEFRRYAVMSCRSQTVGGTAQEKVPFEVIRMLRLMRADENCVRGWLVLGGTGWGEGVLRFFRLELGDYLVGMRGRVVVISTDELLTMKDFV
jgi:hypothetical protein